MSNERAALKNMANTTFKMRLNKEWIEEEYE